MNKLVIDVGGTFIKYAIMDMEANILSKGSVPTPLDSRDHFLNVLANLFEEASDQVDGIAISLPGNIDSSTGYVYTPGSLWYNANTNVAQDLRALIFDKTGKDVPVAIENDGKSAALAELWKGNLAGCDSGVVMILGTGIGGGIILDGKIVKGKNFFAGELSFLMKDVSKKGFEECLAHACSTSALTKKCAAAKKMEESEVDGFKVFEWLEQEDPAIHEVFNEVVDAIAGTIYNMTCILNPERVLIGGGISKQPRLIEAIKEKTNTYYDSVLVPMPRTEVNVCKHFNDSNLIGALYNYSLLYE
ncbi:ROK family protein [Dubosiella newyorkensis]|uniref:ROK family protein n=1 Tax=Dubosiella newyorkensis TaxID=1862672 RepID=UPI0023F2A70E|nr:ROK family protein [Dubosiella newyorkensis]